jgi:hypothetical protein
METWKQAPLLYRKASEPRMNLFAQQCKTDGRSGADAGARISSRLGQAEGAKT